METAGHSRAGAVDGIAAIRLVTGAEHAVQEHRNEVAPNALGDPFIPGADLFGLEDQLQLGTRFPEVRGTGAIDVARP
jgi:hypothetical protein